MAGTRFQVRTYGDVIVARKLAKLADRAGDMSPAWPAVKEIVARGYERSFAQEGPGWPALKESTVRQRIAEGFTPGPIRTRSGRNRRMMSNPIRLRSIGRPSSLDIFTTDPIGLYHQLGTSRMPARPLKLTRWYMDEISRAIRKALMDGYESG